MQLKNTVCSFFGEYKTVRYVVVESKLVALIHMLVLVGILSFVICVIVYQKAYADVDDDVQGAVTTDVKGVALTNMSSVLGLQDRIWDVADYVVPPKENNAFFVITNLIVTENQTIGTCEEDPDVYGADCTQDPGVCKTGESLLTGNGYMTGNCINSTRKNDTKVCEVFAWCETERHMDPPNPPVLLESKNFTVHIMSDIEFPKYGVKRTNMNGYNDNELLTCRYKQNDPTDKNCPIFILDDIVSSAGENYDEMAVKGGVIQIRIDWNCDLDKGEDKCHPTYTFRRLDSKTRKETLGYNFRYAHYYQSANGREYRRLYRAYGITFIIIVQGTASKFCFFRLLLSLGSGLVYLSAATVIVDFAIYFKSCICTNEDSEYKKAKYKNVNDLCKSSTHSCWNRTTTSEPRTENIECTPV